MNPRSLAVDLLEGDTFQITETDKWGHGALVWDHDLARLSSHANLQTEVADAINDRECDENPIENIQDSTRRRLFVEADDDSDLPTGMVYCAPHTSHKILCIDNCSNNGIINPSIGYRKHDAKKDKQCSGNNPGRQKCS